MSNKPSKQVHEEKFSEFKKKYPNIESLGTSKQVVAHQRKKDYYAGKRKTKKHTKGVTSKQFTP